MIWKIKMIFNDLVYNLEWLKVINSPFKVPRLRWYFGKIAVGVPYFYPRKWVKFTKQDAVQKTVESMNNPQMVKKSFNEWYQYYRGHTKPIPLKIGFSYCGLGWKTKWSDTDIRFEWSPVFSFVFFGYQIACTIEVDHPDQYWSTWVYYNRHTDKTKSKRERLVECRKGFPNIWKVSEKGNPPYTVDYYNLILKRKYL